MQKCLAYKFFCDVISCVLLISYWFSLPFISFCNIVELYCPAVLYHVLNHLLLPRIFSSIPAILCLFLISPSSLASLLLCTSQAGLYPHHLHSHDTLQYFYHSTPHRVQKSYLLVDHKLPKEKYYSFFSLYSEKKIVYII